MQLKMLNMSEILSLRSWLETVYVSGHAYINIKKEQLVQLKDKLSEIDKEVLHRVLDDTYMGVFFDEKFEETLEKVRSGELDEPSKQSE